jgi:hypothetical protein
VKITFPLFPAAGPTDVATAHAAIATTVENERAGLVVRAQHRGSQSSHIHLSQRSPTGLDQIGSRDTLPV